MAKSLIIVESPAKTKTLKNFLGGAFQIEASIGHVRDLPQHRLGVDVDQDFKPTYTILPDRKEVVARLGAAARKADTVYLASDPDREGEAIAWHIAQALHLKNPKRITFNEITRRAVEDAIRHPKSIDDRLVNAQEARRVLDRLVGYRLSPLISSKVRSKLSAGRVQSVAVRLVCDREREIMAFVPVEYWSLTATLTPQPPEPRFPFEAKFIGRGKEKISLPNEEEASRILHDLDGARYEVDSIRKREQKRNPSPPFITSTLQQEASRKLGFGNRRTMSVAQQLYEGIEIGAQGSVGLITYMRTDSTRVAGEAQQEARKFIVEQFGPEYIPATPKQYAARGGAQDAHEAIRPTSVLRTPESVAEFLDNAQLRLYRLIWQRFVASQMVPAIFDVTTADILANGYTLRATGSIRKFDGFMAVYTEGKDTEEVSDEERAPLPNLEKGQYLDLISLIPKQHFTEPPPRYTEATLVKALEEKGIGRPSTYASIIAVIQDREYVVLEEKKFRPTDLGFTVNDLLVKNFPDILDIGFTAGMETKLDSVEEGRMDKVKLLRDFYGPFDQTVNHAFETVESLKPPAVETDIICPNCGKKMMLRQSARGPFLGCSGYPKCKTVLNEDGTARGPELTEHSCPLCGKPMVVRQSARGPFLGCSGYPKCKGTVNLDGDKPVQPTGEAAASDQKCPKCGKPMAVRQSARGPFLGCTGYPKCKGLLKLDGQSQESKAKEEPVITDQKCPNCGKPLAERQGRFGKFLGCTGYPKCKTIVRLAGDSGPASASGGQAGQSTGIKCPKDAGEIMEKRSRRGATFYGCSNYPKCDFTTWHRPLERTCPTCGHPLGEQSYRGRPTGSIRCTNPDCEYEEKAAASPVA